MTTKKRAGAAVVLAVVAIISGACSREVIQHGRLKYDVNEVFESDPIALALAKEAGRGNATEIRRLVSAGAKVNTVGKSGITPLWWAIWAENYDGFAALLEAGADPNTFRAEGYPIMHLAARNEDSRFVTAALKHGGNPDTLDNESETTPLHWTVMFGLKDQTFMLLKAGANVNVQQRISGQTLLMTAIGASVDYQLVFELLQMGADPTLKTSDGRTLADTIGFVTVMPDSDRYLWREKVMALLRERGIKVNRPANESPRK